MQQRLPQSSRWPSRQGAQIGPTAGRDTVASTWSIKGCQSWLTMLAEAQSPGARPVSQNPRQMRAVGKVPGFVRGVARTTPFS